MIEAMSSGATKTVRRMPSNRISVLSVYRAWSTDSIPPLAILARMPRYTEDGSVPCTATSERATSAGSLASDPAASRWRRPSLARRSRVPIRNVTIGSPAGRPPAQSLA